jgi:hypothetical protein
MREGSDQGAYRTVADRTFCDGHNTLRVAGGRGCRRIIVPDRRGAPQSAVPICAGLRRQTARAGK